MSFEIAISEVKALTTKPTNQELLNLYANYKQATIGDIRGPKPSRFAVKQRAKYTAWESRKGRSSADAKRAYIAHARTIVHKYNKKTF